ncbi:ATP-binding protein [Bacillus pseudomycoides]|uniref:ATP-binding protein n=1 Tax=Bacillus pseudomycoides TaxID=64104 RepID=UPI000BF1D09C|nr:ATP-binding protein [Bacillus pseudomycoides]PEI51998.1 transposase [Bacillus pseudomycoides]PGA70814.1 transposase [Bacillus pseudomycoides]PHE10628.1 transposase [Bacillus pseudomycoides]PHE91116.1 transposase [Bacillus pseudomycoides]
MNEPVNFRNITQAVYVEQEVVDFRGNPLIEALPPILSPEEAYEKMSYYPAFDEIEASLPTHVRYHAIPRINRFFQPVMQHLDLEQRFSRLLRHGYVSRNPRLPDYNRALNGTQDIRSTASSMTLMGFSGIGKTTAIERILSLYPQVILHEYPLNLMQVVWLKLNCPHDGSLKSLCLDFFLKMDQLLGTNYYEKFGSRRNSISSMVTRMGQIARLHCIGAIVIDEIQHLLATRDNNSEKMMNFFVTLVNEVGVPIMMIGTMRAKAVLQQDFCQARRGSGQGDMVWQQMKKGDDWNLLIESLWEYQWIKHHTPLTEELNQALYDESQGIVDIAVKLFALAQGRAIETGVEQFTLTAIKQVAKDDLKLVQPMLKALRDGRTSELEKYADIMPMDIEEYLVLRQSKIDLRATIQRKKERQSQKRQEKSITSVETIMNSLISLGIDVEVAQKIATKTIKENTDLSLPQLMKIAIEHADTVNRSKARSVKQEDTVLLRIVEKAKKNKQSNYEALKEAGYIKSPMDEFAI